MSNLSGIDIMKMEMLRKRHEIEREMNGPKEYDKVEW